MVCLDGCICINCFEEFHVGETAEYIKSLEEKSLRLEKENTRLLAELDLWERTCRDCKEDLYPAFESYPLK